MTSKVCDMSGREDWVFTNVVEKAMDRTSCAGVSEV